MPKKICLLKKKMILFEILKKQFGGRTQNLKIK